MCGWPAAAQMAWYAASERVDELLERAGMPDRRHAADDEAGAAAHEVGVRLADGLADER